MTRLYRRLGYGLCITAVTLVMAGCASRSFNRAPVEDRMARPGVTAPSDLVPVNQPPGFENAGKPGYYTVKPGDNLLRISLENGQSTQDLTRWNQLENPNRIEVGQVLRVIPPVGSEVVIKPIAKPQVVATPAGSATASATDIPAAPTSSPAAVEDGINWIWPANGAVLAGFDDVKNKGIDIGGKAGDTVVAAADGRVVYVGAGLRGYGNLIILKHNNVFLTAYAHNQTLLVKEDQSVLKGQKIAEMGSSDADRVKLHFEVRRQGKPVDPAKYLPAR
ncbi:peptidoglycan DD-metalloendopeptidase family protein [Rhodoferax antarcticus]|uniref:peptidoglycan DD-metalloendopeptidase family protein n=1 Tax=Rhodoferax antarcticus TaxID=81479 RepID=UPI00094FC68C|nr:peptidoglycan DD-metalloendopeptidase family protein [Rhodoferax antarcticus]APW48342.1 peptidase [Rhodoferax antarcticus]MCW2313201.1 lipoprotein NlpD [Rhodoferax antarcticus]